MRPLDFLSACVVMLIWGLNFVAVKVGVAEIPPILMTALRFAIVGLLVAPFFCLPRRHLKTLLLLSTVMGIFHFSFMFVGLSGVDAAAVAITIQLGVPFSSLLAFFFFGDKLGWRRGVGMLLAFGGVVLLAGEPQMTNPAWLLFIVGAALAWAVGNVISKKLSDLHPMQIVGFMGLFAAPQLLVLSLLIEDNQRQALAEASWMAWGGVAFVTLLSSLTAYTLWYRLLGRYAVNQVVPFSLLGPVIGIFAGILLLGEPATWYKAIGGVMTIAGVTIIQLRQMRDDREARMLEGKS